MTILWEAETTEKWPAGVWGYPESECACTCKGWGVKIRCGKEGITNHYCTGGRWGFI